MKRVDLIIIQVCLKMIQNPWILLFAETMQTQIMKSIVSPASNLCAWSVLTHMPKNTPSSSWSKLCLKIMCFYILGMRLMKSWISTGILLIRSMVQETKRSITLIASRFWWHVQRVTLKKSKPLSGRDANKSGSSSIRRRRSLFKGCTCRSSACLTSWWWIR